MPVLLASGQNLSGVWNKRTPLARLRVACITHLCSTSPDTEPLPDVSTSILLGMVRWNALASARATTSCSITAPLPHAERGKLERRKKNNWFTSAFGSGPGASGMVLAEAVVASNVLIGGGVGVVGVQTAQEAPGFKDFVSFLADSPANPAVLFDADPSNWR